MEGMGEDMEHELEDDGQSELSRMQKATLGDSDLAQYAIAGNEKVRLTQCAYDPAHHLSRAAFNFHGLFSASVTTSSINVVVGLGVGDGSCRWKGERQRFGQSNWRCS